MSGIQVELQPAHGFVPLLVVLLLFARKLYGIDYPQNAKAFNCVQRGHQNIMENIPIFLALIFTSSIYRPQIAAIASFVRVLAFIVYMRGYSSGDPKKRLQGSFGV
ncbi:Membrane associated eicosanoid/glutathione metabolism-like domain [Phytophthora cactorum]|nr:Membrane associated eicosanoid/glutathione metabolism-like domain [Phytophthora cactorum]